MSKRKDAPSIASLMSVIRATVDTADGIEFPGEWMISGKPVRAPGVKVAALMTDAAMAQQWHDAVRQTYEREKSERDAPRSNEAPHGGAGGREDRSTHDGGGGSKPAPVDEADPKAFLQARKEAGDRRIQAITEQLTLLEDELWELKRRQEQLVAALAAFGGDDDDIT